MVHRLGKRWLAVLAVAALGAPAHAADGLFEWVQAFGGVTSEVPVDIARDSAGAIVVVGTYSSATSDFDPGPGTATLTAFGGNNVYVLKLDAAGDFVWVKGLGGTGNESVYSVAIDGDDNIHIAGGFSATADFDPNAGTANLTSAGTTDAFWAILDSDGDYVSAVGWGGAEQDWATAVAIDGNGNRYIVGLFDDTVDFDPTAGTAELTADISRNAFIVQMDASNTFQWVAGFIGNIAQINSATVDLNDDLIVAGAFLGTVDFDPSLADFDLASISGFDVFAAKLDDAGALQWAVSTGGTGADGATEVTDDASGNLYVTGYFESTVDFDHGAGVEERTADGNDDFFLTSLTSGGAFRWARTGGGAGTDTAWGVAAGTTGVYAGGHFDVSGELDAGAGSQAFVSAGSIDAYILKTDFDGDVEFMRTFGGAGIDAADEIVLDENDGALVLGSFRQTADFDPTDGVANRTSAGNIDVYVARYTRAPEVASVTAVTASPTNAASVVFTVVFDESVTGVDISDFSVATTGLAAGSVTNVTGSGTTYTVTITLSSGDGTVALDIVDDDSIENALNQPLGGTGGINGSFDAAADIDLDWTDPTVVMNSAAADPTNASPIAVTVIFNEPVTGFTAGDIGAVNGTVNNFAGSGANYTFDLVPAGNGLVTATIAANVATDAVGNGNAAAADFTRTFSSVQPTVSMTSPAGNPTNITPIAVTVTFSETVTGFAAGDIAAANGAVSGFTGSGADYAFVLTPAGQGAVSATIAAGTAQSLAANPNQAGAFATVFDSLPPVIVLNGDAAITLFEFEPYSEEGAAANDANDGDLSAEIVIDASAVNTAVAGVYQVTYNVADAAGNPATTVTRTVEVLPASTGMPLNAPWAIAIALTAAAALRLRRKS